LPEAHVEAPTSGSVILAAILLKLGYYGLIRILFSCFKYACNYYSFFISLICIIGSIYGAMIAIVQIDLKRIVAYSSVSHMSLGILGLFTFSMNGFIGSNIIMISHTFISSALFLLVGIIYDRFHNRLLNYYTGLINFMPIYSFFLFYFIISNFGFPLSLSFIAEMFIFLVIGK
jgi:NADH:ubiquinone oxidoreductase subunit 4 (subunit M)